MTRSILTGVLGPPEGVRFGADRAFVIDRTIETAIVHAARQLTGVSENQRHLVRRALLQAIEERWTKAQLKNRIERIIGLGSRYALAVERYHAGLLKNGVPPARARRMANSYANRLARYRSRVIAEHEVRLAASEGKRALWTQQQQDGVLPDTVQRVWVLHPGEKHCPACRKMRGKKTNLTDEYHGGLVGPPAHPNCRCWEVVVSNGVRLDSSGR